MVTRLRLIRLILYLPAATSTTGKKRSVWNRALDAFNGGRAYIVKTLKKHPSETEAEFNARCDIAYHLNLIKYATKSFW